MCGPADFGALHTSIVHLAELSAVGLASYSVCKVGALFRDLRREQDKRDRNALQDQPAGLAAESSSGRPDA